MPYILYSLKTDRAKYLSASTVSAEGYERTRMAAAHYARIPKSFTYVTHSFGGDNHPFVATDAFTPRRQ